MIDNKSIIKKIDKLNFSKTTFEVSIDDNENIIDTLSIEKTKSDENGNVLFEFKEIWNEYGKIIKQTYYRDTKDLFYQKTDYKTKSIDFGSEYQTFVNKENIIDKAQMVTFEPDNVDTIFMKYNYSYNSKGKKESLAVVSIYDSINSINFTKYNKNEKAEIRYQIIDNDTLEKSKIKYLKGKIIESTHEYKEPFRIEVYYYDNNKNVKSRKIFKKENDSLKKSFEYIYENNDLRNPEKIIIKDFEKDTIVKRKLITANNNGYDK
ncbi:hypothetical protein LPB136_01340 [Tenacibaculum todarodis]|uniref:Uncharacterized protein n=1 Tax=Tenacibaculum todarodis TaxID=1850252 RepID=A0A1L3JG56_9FLAO|nr:hypothetical protein [Tenacibaculum todarodis]APG64094.1 hypothetical protein LPB136_01340 [Tenacibaculum todarodis]